MAAEHVLYVIVRRDLLTALNWPLGAVLAQVAHAVSAVIWKYKDDPNVLDYMAHMDRMRKVVLEVGDEAALRNISETLNSQNVDHCSWIEQPEDIHTCVAVKPYPKKAVHPIFKHLKLFS